jgi:hypothetical protein
VLADDPDDPMRTALRQVAGVFAKLDRHMVVKRLRDGRTAKSSDGRKAVGQYAYGYIGSGKGRTRDSSPLAVEQAVIGRISSCAKGRTFLPRHLRPYWMCEGHKPRRARSLVTDDRPRHRPARQRRPARGRLTSSDGLVGHDEPPPDGRLVRLSKPIHRPPLGWLDQASAPFPVSCLRSSSEDRVSPSLQTPPPWLLPGDPSSGRWAVS